MENGCTLSACDDRGRGGVFADVDKMRDSYPLLMPCFLPYGMEEMERLNNGQP